MKLIFTSNNHNNNNNNTISLQILRKTQKIQNMGSLKF